MRRSIRAQFANAKLPWRASGLLLWVAALMMALGGYAPAVAASTPLPPNEGMTVKVPGGIAKLAMGQCGLPGQIVATTPKGAYFEVTGNAGGIGLELIENCVVPNSGTIMGMLDDGVITRGSNSVAMAWLAQPTRRYGHGILGDAVEAAELRIATGDGGQYYYQLDEESVFEDLMARVVDLEGDGLEEVLVVRSRLRAGAAAAVFGLEQGKLVLLAESEPIGRSNRWLNPVGVADFDGDGKREVAVVLTPHIGGILTLCERKGRKLVRDHESRGYSNHAIGSRELGMSVIVDFNADGVPGITVPGITVPGAHRRSLRIVTFAGGRFAELRNLKYGAEITTAILPANSGTQIRQDLVFGLADGTLVRVQHWAGGSNRRRAGACGKMAPAWWVALGSFRGRWHAPRLCFKRMQERVEHSP